MAEGGREKEMAGTTSTAKMKKCALVLVDIQKDFCAGGSLAVEGGDATAAVANRLRKEGEDVFEGRVFLTQDWHPSDHISFASVNGKPAFSSISLTNAVNGEEYQQTVWPDHCVQGSNGAQFLDSLVVEEKDVVVQKGTNKEIDSYSGFFDNNHASATELHAQLAQSEVTDLCVIGIATDVCVHFTILDAVKMHGYNVVVVLEGCAGIDKENIEKSILAWKEAGVQVVDTVDDYFQLV